MNIRGAGILRVRPPVVALGKEIVFSSGAARGRRSGDGERRFAQIFSGGTENSSAVDGGNVKAGHEFVLPVTSEGDVRAGKACRPRGSQKCGEKSSTS